jgi:hypothetical protein
MHLIRTALALTLAGTTLTLSAPTTGSAATITRIVIYKGGGDKAPVGPKGPLTSNWTLYKQPAKITTTDDGTLVVDLNLNPTGGCPPFSDDCGWWRYSTGGAELLDLYWDQPNHAGKVEVTGLRSILNDSSAWIDLGNGVYSPKCLDWSPSYGVVDLIGLDVSTYTWSKMSTLQECNELPG